MSNKVNRIAILFCFAFLVANIGFSVSAQSQICMVFDPADTGVNVRLTPNGVLINRLRNGRAVVINEIGYDTQRRPWARVSGYYQGQWRRWGWVFTDLVRCR